MSIVDVAPIVLLQLTDERPVCSCCDDRIADDDERLTDPNGEPICESCHDDEVFTCNGSGRIGWRDDAVAGPDGELYNERYADNHFSTCDDCGLCEWTDNTYYSEAGSGRTICEDCYCNNYFTCNDCGETLHQDEHGSDGYCTECEPCNEDDESSLIKPYSDKSVTSLGFFGESKDKVFFGVELETECPSGDRHDYAERVLESIGDDFIVLKEDGSLSNGFEIVTAPATIDEHAKRFKPAMTDGTMSGMKSWNTSTCGMHVHVSRKPLSDLTVGKVLVFVNDKANQDFISVIAGRSDVHWCKVSEKKISDAHQSKRYCGSNADRYTAVNVTGRNTIEFRIFKGTLKYESFMKNLEFVRSVVTFCRSAGIQELTIERYLDHVKSRRRDYPNLVTFLREKGFLPRPKPARSFQSSAH